MSFNCWDSTVRGFKSQLCSLKTWKHPERPTADEWIKKMCHMYPVEYYSAIEEKEIRPLAATRKQLDMIPLREVRQKGTHHRISLTCEI